MEAERVTDWPFRLKHSLDDFQVAERCDFPLDGGRFAVYLLRKRNIGTLEAIDALRPLLQSPNVSFAGLKDKYAVSEQFVTAELGPPRNVSIGEIELEHIGFADRPIDSKDIVANRFTVVLRDMPAETCERLDSSLANAGSWKTPNYFDEQRFGSLGERGVFIAEPWCRGDFEGAIRLFLTDPNIHDESGARREKQVIAEHWNAWHELPRLYDPVRHDVVSHIAATRGDFRGAIARIPHGMRSLLLSAFQSALWNRWLSAEIEARIDSPAVHRFTIANASLAMPTAADDEGLLDFELPFPTARHRLEDDASARRIAEILKDYNLEYRELRVKYPRDTFFSKGMRPAGFQPGGLEWRAADDDVFPGRRMIRLEFDLPRGCYATMFVRRLAAT